jgi:ABC-type multidrug transport system ATPase subunit
MGAFVAGRGQGACLRSWVPRAGEKLAHCSLSHIFVVCHLQSAIVCNIPSGKSTLLHAIAGNVKHDKKVTLYGKRYINNETLTGDSRIPLAFIEQEVTFFPHMTVKETLDFQVELKMGAVLKTKEERDDLVQDLIDQLGLTKSANTIVGNAKVRGLSGGERKRLSIACEMISSPPVIFLDEPTSGLDSYQAAQVIETLRRLADTGKTIVSVIHQPSQHVFQLFDDLLLLSEGRLMYFGEVAKVRLYMSDLGYECESEVGTAEHILDCVSRAVGADAEAESLSTKRIENIASQAIKHTRELVAFGADNTNKMKHIIDKTSAHPGTNVFRQFRLLLGRSARELVRGKAAILIKIVQQVSLGVIYGGIYNLGDDQVRRFFLFLFLQH